MFIIPISLPHQLLPRQRHETGADRSCLYGTVLDNMPLVGPRRGPSSATEEYIQTSPCPTVSKVESSVVVQQESLTVYERRCRNTDTWSVSDVPATRTDQGVGPAALQREKARASYPCLTSNWYTIGLLELYSMLLHSTNPLTQLLPCYRISLVGPFDDVVRGWSFPKIQSSFSISWSFAPPLI
jgi:hypothetical protein